MTHHTPNENIEHNPTPIYIYIYLKHRIHINIYNLEPRGK